MFNDRVLYLPRCQNGYLNYELKPDNTALTVTEMAAETCMQFRTFHEGSLKGVWTVTMLDSIEESQYSYVKHFMQQVIKCEALLNL